MIGAKVFGFVLVCLVLAIIANAIHYSKWKEQVEQYKVLELQYAADTTDRGNTERKLTEIINKR